MPQKRYRPEEIIAKLREAEVLLGQRPPAPETLAWPGFSLKDYAPPALTPETALAL